MADENTTPPSSSSGANYLKDLTQRAKSVRQSLLGEHSELPPAPNSSKLAQLANQTQNYSLNKDLYSFRDYQDLSDTEKSQLLGQTSPNKNSTHTRRQLFSSATSQSSPSTSSQANVFHTSPPNLSSLPENTISTTNSSRSLNNNLYSSHTSQVSQEHITSSPALSEVNTSSDTKTDPIATPITNSPVLVSADTNADTTLALQVLTPHWEELYHSLPNGITEPEASEILFDIVQAKLNGFSNEDIDGLFNREFSQTNSRLTQLYRANPTNFINFISYLEALADDQLQGAVLLGDTIKPQDVNLLRYGELQENSLWKEQTEFLKSELIRRRSLKGLIVDTSFFAPPPPVPITPQSFSTTNFDPSTATTVVPLPITTTPIVTPTPFVQSVNQDSDFDSGVGGGTDFDSEFTTNSTDSLEEQSIPFENNNEYYPPQTPPVETPPEQSSISTAQQENLSTENSNPNSSSSSSESHSTDQIPTPFIISDDAMPDVFASKNEDNYTSPISNQTSPQQVPQSSSSGLNDFTQNQVDRAKKSLQNKVQEKTKPLTDKVKNQLKKRTNVASERLKALAQRAKTNAVRRSTQVVQKIVSTLKNLPPWVWLLIAVVIFLVFLIIFIAIGGEDTDFNENYSEKYNQARKECIEELREVVGNDYTKEDLMNCVKSKLGENLEGPAGAGYTPVSSASEIEIINKIAAAFCQIDPKTHTVFGPASKVDVFKQRESLNYISTPAELASLAVAIARAESGLNSNALNTDNPGHAAVGLFQIYNDDSASHRQKNFNIDQNIAEAVNKYKQAGFCPWDVFKASGSYNGNCTTSWLGESFVSKGKWRTNRNIIAVDPNTGQCTYAGNIQAGSDVYVNNDLPYIADSPGETYSNTNLPFSPTGNKIADFAGQHVGRDTNRDCSGFTKYVLRNAAGNTMLEGKAAACSGKTRGSNGMYRYLIDDPTRYSQHIVWHRGGSARNMNEAMTGFTCQPGDIVFYTNGNNNCVRHVAVYVGNGMIVDTTISNNVARYRKVTDVGSSWFPIACARVQ